MAPRAEAFSITGSHRLLSTSAWVPIGARSFQPPPGKISTSASSRSPPSASNTRPWPQRTEPCAPSAASRTSSAARRSTSSGPIASSSSMPSKTAMSIRNPPPFRTSGYDADWGLGRFGFRLRRRRGLQRVLQNVLDSRGQVEGHRLAHALGDVVDVLLVALREDDFLETHAVSREHLLLDAADRQHQSLQ